MNAADFITKWSGVSASELATSQSFLRDLCDLLDVEHPHPTEEQDYMFERPVTFSHGDGSTSAGRIDLYRRDCFVLESKKITGAVSGRKVDESLLRARSQAENYARALPSNEGRPPFLIVVDVGNRIELYAEFSRSGATYTPFPDPRSHRIALSELADEGVRERLRQLWTDPMSLDPARQSARVTREIAARLAELARSLEASGIEAERRAGFMSRCLFTMFAEDVGLLPEEAFARLLQQHREQPDTAMRMLQALWQDMDRGGFSAVLAGEVLQFNGKLFKQPEALPLTREQIDLLIEAAKADWRHVEPAIFGTLLERALDPRERHKLGAHYTPRAYVERLVLPTVIEPLRQEWDEAHAAALTLADEGKTDAAVAELQRFHHRLCGVRVLDPACGSGNFLYVTLEHLKRLEGEVLNALDEIGASQTGLALDSERFDATAAETVDPHNLLGIEINTRAATIAELVLWIGYLQWHFKTRGDVKPPQPVIRDFRNIENRDAVLAYDRVEFETDDTGKPVTRWDGVTMKTSPVTGKDIPDESAQLPIERYVNPRKADWPEADFVVGNPPFIGNKRMRATLGDGYVDALRKVWPDVPESSDFVMYWWHNAACLTRQGELQRFGLITTNSIRQSFNRRVLESHMADKKQPLSMVFAVPDHPWVDTADGAAVRIAMTVGDGSAEEGRVLDVVDESQKIEGEVQCRFVQRRGLVHSDLRAELALAKAGPLNANLGLAFTGMYPLGQGFVLQPDDVATAVGNDANAADVVKPFVIARDLTQTSREARAIDFYPRSEEEARRDFPSLYQWVFDRVKPERDHNPRSSRRERWWVFAEPVPALRAALAELDQMLVVPRTAKWFSFQRISSSTVPDTSVVAIASDDLNVLGVLSSSAHLAWAVAAGGRLGVGNDTRYQHQRTFNPYPFPDLDALAGRRIGELAEQLDTHRKRQQAAHPGLTLTGMYNVLEKLRTGEELTPKERSIHEQGLVSVLRQIHDELDAAVLEAYGWDELIPTLRIAHGNDPATEDMSQGEAKQAFEDAVLERLVALNAQRAAEETRGHVRWLRPEFQNPQAAETATQAEIDTAAVPEKAVAPAAAPAKRIAWPKDPVAQVRAVAEALAASPAGLDEAQLAARFKGRGPWKRRLPALLDMLVAVGRARVENERYVGI